MPIKPRQQPELLPGADADKDCQTGQEPDGPATGVELSPDSSATAATGRSEALPDGVEESISSSADASDPHDDDDHEHDVTWTTVETAVLPAKYGIEAWQPQRSRWALWLERAALIVEKPISRLTLPQLNLFYHTGTIAVLLLAIVGVTGTYLFFFFQYGYDASYLAVERMESQFIARFVRAIHRYSSGALVVVTLLHAYRTLFLEKFRGPRWLAWITGIGMTVLLWLAGVTGYWLIWDTRAQVIENYFRSFLENVTSLTPAYMVQTVFAGERGDSWAIFLVLLALHVVLFLVVAGFFVLHIRRLSRPRWLPPVEWVAIIGVAIALVSILFPAGMLPQADLNQLPGPITFDPLFLFYLPFAGSGWFWLLLLGAVLFFAALPWLSRKRRQERLVSGIQKEEAVAAAEVSSGQRVELPRVHVNILKDRCTGCTKCALDCPYGAIEMVERHDGRPHKFIAIEEPDLCVACGICVGSCDGVAVTMGSVPPESLWELIQHRSGILSDTLSDATGELPFERRATERVASQSVARMVVYTCERHAQHGARHYLQEQAAQNNRDIVVIPLPCVGAIPPDMLTRTLDSGVKEIRVVGCPPYDCANREGNIWTAQRLTRQRVPRLRKPYADAPISAHWLPPNEFEKALNAPVPHDDAGKPDYPQVRKLLRAMTWRDYLPAALFVLALLLIQVFTNDLPIVPYPDPPGVVQVVWERPDEPFGELLASQTADTTYILQLNIDGASVYEESLTAETVLGSADEPPRPLFIEAMVEPGLHEIRLTLTGNVTGAQMILVEDQRVIAPGEIQRPDLRAGAVQNCGESEPCLP